MYDQHDAFLNPQERWVDVVQWSERDQDETTDRHYLSYAVGPETAAEDTLDRLGFLTQTRWRPSFARPGQWHAILDRKPVAR